MEVINPYELGPVYNANLFVSQYCAAKEKDFAEISITDMAAVMRGGNPISTPTGGRKKP